MDEAHLAVKSGQHNTEGSRGAALSWEHIALLLVMLLVVAVLGYSTATTDRLGRLFVAQVEAVMSARLQVTEAHLWLEEIVSGDSGESVSDVHALLDDAYRKLVMLEGEAGSAIGIADPALLSEIREAEQWLGRFRDIAAQRLDGGSDESGVGSDLDAQFDAAFESFESSMQRVNSGLNVLIDTRLKHFVAMQVAMLGVVLCVFLWIVWLLRRRTRLQQTEHVKALQASFAELEQSRLELERQNHLRGRLVEANALMQGVHESEHMARLLLGFLCEQAGAHAAAFWSCDKQGQLNPLASYAIDKAHFLVNKHEIKNSLVGQALRMRSPLAFETPKNYLQVKSGIGHIDPGHVRVIPLLHDNDVVAIAELAWLKKPAPDIVTLCETVLANVAMRFRFIAGQSFTA